MKGFYDIFKRHSKHYNSDILYVNTFTASCEIFLTDMQKEKVPLLRFFYF